MTFLDLVYNNKTINDFEGVHNINKNMSDENIKIIRYRLRQNDTVNKFIDCLKSSLREPLVKFSTYYYFNLNEIQYITCKKQLNLNLARANNVKQIFDQKFFLEETAIRETEKLNRLHLIFEDESRHLQKHQTLNLKPILEIINYQIHLLEHQIRDSDFLTQVSKVRALKEFKYAMQQEDYELREIPKFGSLLLDEHILGKSLVKSLSDEDLSLIESQQVQIQQYITSSIKIHFSNDLYYEGKQQLYFNKMKKYNESLRNYNLNDVKYKFGEIVLGDPVDVNYYDQSYWKVHIMNGYKNLIDIRLSD